MPKEKRRFVCPKCKDTITFKSLVPYQKTVARGCCRKCSLKGERTCPRCNTTIQYISKSALRENLNAPDCKACRIIPDTSLEAFKQGRFVLHCPKCNGEQEYCNRSGYRQARSNRPVCHSCAAKENAPGVAKKVKAWRKSLTPRQRKALSKKYSEGIRKAWAALPEEEKERRREVTRQCQIEYHANRSVEERDAWLRNLKASFQKWRGKNHWMNRVSTMAKVHASYMKYTGKNHWRHRPGVHEKILATLKHNKHIKETCGEL